ALGGTRTVLPVLGPAGPVAGRAPPGVFHGSGEDREHRGGALEGGDRRVDERRRGLGLQQVAFGEVARQLDLQNAVTRTEDRHGQQRGGRGEPPTGSPPGSILHRKVSSSQDRISRQPQNDARRVTRKVARGGMFELEPVFTLPAPPSAPPPARPRASGS